MSKLRRCAREEERYSSIFSLFPCSCGLLRDELDHFYRANRIDGKEIPRLPDGCGARTNRSGYSCRASRTDVSVYLDLSHPGFVPVDENWLCCLLGIEPVIIFTFYLRRFFKPLLGGIEPVFCFAPLTCDFERGPGHSYSCRSKAKKSAYTHYGESYATCVGFDEKFVDFPNFLVLQILNLCSLNFRSSQQSCF